MQETNKTKLAQELEEIRGLPVEEDRFDNMPTVVVECDVAKLEEVKAAIKAAGGKVL